MNLCVFYMPWRGACANPCSEDNKYCPEHLGLKCSCGEQARGKCDVTIGPMVHGRPTCTYSKCAEHGSGHRNNEYNRELFLRRQEAAGYVGTD